MSNYQVQAQVVYRRLLQGIGTLIATKARNRRKEAAVAKAAKDIVLERTAAGIDTNGRKFRDYSPAYKRFKTGAVKTLKRAAGKRKNTGVATAYPSYLKLTGHMLRELKCEVTADATLRGVVLKIKFRFNDPEAAQIAEYHDSLGAGKSRVKRQFLGLSREGTSRRKAEEETLYKAWRNG